MPPSSLLTLIYLKRQGPIRLDHAGRRVFVGTLEEARAFVRDWNTRHKTKSMQVWYRAERRLYDL